MRRYHCCRHRCRHHCCSCRRHHRRHRRRHRHRRRRLHFIGASLLEHQRTYLNEDAANLGGHFTEPDFQP